MLNTTNAFPPPIFRTHHPNIKVTIPTNHLSICLNYTILSSWTILFWICQEVSIQKHCILCLPHFTCIPNLMYRYSFCCHNSIMWLYKPQSLPLLKLEFPVYFIRVTSKHVYEHFIFNCLCFCLKIKMSHFTSLQKYWQDNCLVYA